MSVDNYKPLYIWRSPASIPQIVAHIQDYLVKHPILSTETIAEIIVDALGDHPELLNGSVIPITQDSAQSIKAYIDSLPILDTYTKAQIDSLLEGKEDALTFDTTPTEDSGNPVTSGGIYSALAALDTALQLMIADKADISSVYTKAQTDSLLLDKADADNVYSKNTIEAKLLTKANIDSVYSIQDVDAMRIVNNANMAIRTTDNMAPIDISAGQYVYLGDILYMTTAPVLTGDELIPGINCVLNPTGALNRIGDGLQNVAAQTNIQSGEITALQGDVSSLSGQIGDLEDISESNVVTYDGNNVTVVQGATSVNLANFKMMYSNKRMLITGVIILNSPLSNVNMQVDIPNPLNKVFSNESTSSGYIIRQNADGTCKGINGITLTAQSSSIIRIVERSFTARNESIQGVMIINSVINFP